MGWSEKYLNACHETQKGNYVRYQEFNLNGIYNVNDTFDTSLALDKYDNIKLSTTNCNLNDNGVLYPFENENDIEKVTMYVSQCFLSPGYGNGTSITQWGYNGNNKYQLTGVGLWFGSLPTNQYCTFLDGFKVRDLRTNTVRALTFDDLLNPSDNYTLTYTSEQAFRTYVKDGSYLNGNAITTIPCLTFVNDNIFASSLANNFTYRMATTWNISTMSDVSSSETTAMAVKNLSDTKKMIFNINGSEHSGNIVFKNDYGAFVSTLNGNLQTLVFEPTLKFFVSILQSTGGYYTLETMTGLWSEDRFKNDDNILLGELDSTGKPTRKWLTSLERQNSVSPNLNPDWENKTNTYNAEKDIPDGDKITPPTFRVTDQIGGFTMYYKCNQADLLTIVQRVNFPDSQHPIPEGWEFTPHLVSCTQYPFNVSQYVGGHASNVIIGSWDSGVNSISLTSTQLAVQTIATFTLDHKYNSFLDYSPYAQYQLYIPLCGWVDLPDQCVGKTITVDLATDVINNSCLATVKADGCPIVLKTGHMGTSISLSVTENGLKQSALTQSLFNTVGAVTSTGYAVATQNPVGIVNGIANVAGAVYQGTIANNSNYTRQVGSTGDKSDFHVSNTCYLKKMYTVPNEPDNYKHTCGYPSDTSGVVGSFTGYNVFTNVDTTGLTCNQSQKEKIKALFESGVYI